MPAILLGTGVKTGNRTKYFLLWGLYSHNHRGWPTSSIKFQITHILGFVGLIVSVTATQLICGKAVIERHTSGHVCVPQNFYLFKQMAD